MGITVNGRYHVVRSEAELARFCMKHGLFRGLLPLWARAFWQEA